MERKNDWRVYGPGCEHQRCEDYWLATGQIRCLEHLKPVEGGQGRTEHDMGNAAAGIAIALVGGALLWVLIWWVAIR